MITKQANNFIETYFEAFGRLQPISDRWASAGVLADAFRTVLLGFSNNSSAKAQDEPVVIVEDNYCDSYIIRALNQRFLSDLHRGLDVLEGVFTSH